MAAHRGSSGRYYSEIESAHGTGLASVKISHAARRQPIRRNEDEEDEEDDHEHDESGDDTDDEDGDDEDDNAGTGGGSGTGGGGSAITPSSGCTLVVGGTSTNHTTCFPMGSGTTYFTLAGNTLSAGFKVKNAAGWSAMAIGKPHQGASAVWSTSCGATCTKVTGVTMRSFSSADIRPPSKIPFSAMKGAKSATGEHSVSFTMPWPGTATSIQVALATGSGAKNQHASKPRVYTVNKADVIAASAAKKKNNKN